MKLYRILPIIALAIAPSYVSSTTSDDKVAIDFGGAKVLCLSLTKCAALTGGLATLARYISPNQPSELAWIPAVATGLLSAAISVPTVIHGLRCGLNAINPFSEYTLKQRAKLAGIAALGAGTTALAYKLAQGL